MTKTDEHIHGGMKLYMHEIFKKTLVIVVMFAC
jgi:hypothetical protein